MIDIKYPTPNFKYKTIDEHQYIFDVIRKKYVRLTPEEWVRQNFLNYLIQVKKYPKGLISVEKEIKINQLRKRYDIVVYDTQRNPWMLIECKAPQVSLTEDTFHQLLRYNQVISAPYWALTNGHQSFCAHHHQQQIEWLLDFPINIL